MAQEQGGGALRLDASHQVVGREIAQERGEAQREVGVGRVGDEAVKARDCFSKGGLSQRGQGGQQARQNPRLIEQFEATRRVGGGEEFDEFVALPFERDLVEGGQGGSDGGHGRRVDVEVERGGESDSAQWPEPIL